MEPIISHKWCKNNLNDKNSQWHETWHLEINSCCVYQICISMYVCSKRLKRGSKSYQPEFMYDDLCIICWPSILEYLHGVYQESNSMDMNFQLILTSLVHKVLSYEPCNLHSIAGEQCLSLCGKRLEPLSKLRCLHLWTRLKVSMRTNITWHTILLCGLAIWVANKLINYSDVKWEIVCKMLM